MIRETMTGLLAEMGSMLEQETEATTEIEVNDMGVVVNNKRSRSASTSPARKVAKTAEE